MVMVSQYDRLGGRPLCWSKLGPYGISPTQPSVTQVCKHHGRYFDRSMKFEDSVFTLCPPVGQLKPSFILVFELFALQSSRNPTGDQVVAWSALPMCNEHLGVVNGKFRLPFLRGEMSPELEHFSGVEKAMAHDLNTWMCNGYIEIRHLPKDITLRDAMNCEQSNITKLNSKPQPKEGVTGELQFDFLSKQVRVAGLEKEKRLAHSKSVLRDRKDKDNNEAVVSPIAIMNSLESLDGKKDSLMEAEATPRPLYPDKSLSSENVAADGLFQRKHNSSKGPLNTSSSGILTNKTFNASSDELLKKSKPSGQNWGAGFFSKSKSSVVPVSFDIEEGGGKSSDQTGASLAGKKQVSFLGGILGSSKEKDDVEVIERGYESGDEFYLDEQQKGKLAGVEAVASYSGRQWASAGLEGKTVRRYSQNVFT